MRSGRWRWATVGVLVITGIAASAGWWFRDRSNLEPSASTAGTVLQTVRTNDFVITLANAGGELRMGSNRFTIEFRSVRTGRLVDVGMVQAGATMSMPGMAMTGTVAATPTGQPGVYEATGEFSMSGAWQMTLEWNGPAGRGSAAFNGDVR